MKKRVFIIHGWDGSPNEPMMKWMKETLEKKRFEVHALEMPNPGVPNIDAWVGTLNRTIEHPDEHTYFIGHSVGCQTILRYLEGLGPKVRIGGCILIAPWMKLDEAAMEAEGEEAQDIAEPWENTPIDWRAVKAHTEHFTCIFSDNDPYVPLENKETFKLHLPTKVFIEKNKGHYTPDDNIQENKLTIKELMKITKEEKTEETHKE